MVEVDLRSGYGASRYSALQGIESTALPTGEYLDIDSPCSLIVIAVVMKNSKPNPSPLPHLLS